jgi:SAM-dependent methyltransferase
VADHPIHAFLYDPRAGVFGAAGMAARRRRLVAEARGRVLEVDGGVGRNVPLYRDVDSVTVLEPAGGIGRPMLDRIAAAAVPIEVHEAGLKESGLPGASFDTVISTLALCAVPNQAVALAEMRRLLKPEGRLLFLEHVRSPGWQGRVQGLTTPVWARVGSGCHLDRATLDAIRAAGFAITDCERSGVVVQGVAKLSKRTVAA